MEIVGLGAYPRVDDGGNWVSGETSVIGLLDISQIKKFRIIISEASRLAMQRRLSITAIG
jgi:hypothetical protein